MRARYHPIEDGVWKDEKFDANLIDALPEASFTERAFFVYLCSNDYQRPSGIYRVTDAQLAASTFLSVADVQQYIPLLERRQLIVRDGAWIFVRGYFSKQPNHERLLAVVQEQVSSCSSEKITSAFCERYPEFTAHLDSSEGALRTRLTATIRDSGMFCGHVIRSVEEEVRVGSGYADLVLLTDTGTKIVVEIKQTRADRGTLYQVDKYAKQIGAPCCAVILAKGLGAKVGKQDFSLSDVALITYDELGDCSLVFSNTVIQDCSDLVMPMLNSVKSQSNDVTSKPFTRAIQSNTDTEQINTTTTPRKLNETNKTRQVPFQWPSPRALVEKYNTESPDECPAVKELSPGRKMKARKYLSMFPNEEFWTCVFQQIHNSKFLRGLKNSEGHEHFIADLDWLLTKGKDGIENAVKVHDGRYADGKR